MFLLRYVMHKVVYSKLFIFNFCRFEVYVIYPCI